MLGASGFRCLQGLGLKVFRAVGVICETVAPAVAGSAGTDGGPVCPVPHVDEEEKVE